MTTSEPRWLQLVRADAARTSIAAVARRLGYSRTAISQVLSGDYPSSTAGIEETALAELEPVLTVACPYIGREILIQVCGDLSSRRAPTHNPLSMGQWGACQRCQNRCKGDVK